MNHKELYEKFGEKAYIPIFSKPWWLDAVCGDENWDVWIYEKGEAILAAMPYYMETRGDYKYITKAPLTQNNGVIINYPSNLSVLGKQKLEEEITNAAMDYIQELGVDVYEQQFHYSYTNFLPFFWRGYTSIPRVTYVIENTSDLSTVEKNISGKYRNKIRKGEKNVFEIGTISPEDFYKEHEKVFKKQSLPCPFSYELWMRLYHACIGHDAGEILAAKNDSDEVLAVLFLVWDDESVYQLLGGAIPEFSKQEAHVVLVKEAIRKACQRGLKYDFEGSVIKRINHSMREYGAMPRQYFRIRKVFSPAIIRTEAEESIRNMR